MRKLLLTAFLMILFEQVTFCQLFEYFFAPEKYIAYRCSAPIRVDGDISEAQWQAASWSTDFVDIEGNTKPKPIYDTNFKMLWDDKNLYIAARLYDKHIWATLQERESVIFEDNDFEVFIDPNGDCHEYMELEINAFGTEWDLFMNKPYRDGGYADNSWNFDGIRTAIKVYGKLNKTIGKDSCWTLEISLPWKSMIQYSDTKKVPVDGEQWRMNFSRVQWKTFIKDGKYIKEKGKNGKPLPEMNWVWSPQGAIAMHQPETWGYVQFSSVKAGDGTADFIENPDSKAIWALWQVYYLYQLYPHNYKKLEEGFLQLQNTKSAARPDFQSIELGEKKAEYLARVPGKSASGFWNISKDGKLWFTSETKE